MTENKRFMSDGWKITDNTNGEDIGMIKTSELLNELYEENVELKQQLHSYKKESEINYNTLEQIHTILKKWEGCPYEQL